MMNINAKASDPSYSQFLWNHKNVFIPASLALPIVLLVSSIAIQIFRDPGIIARKSRELKDFVFSLFTQQENETDSQYKKRLIRNITLVSLVALGFGASVALPFIALPASFAIPTALSIIFLSGELLLNAKRYSEEIPAKWLKFKTGLKYAFKPKPEETKREATLRIIRNVAITTALVAAAGLVAFSIHHMVVVALAAKAAGTFKIWYLQNYLPSQTPAVVFAEYGALALAHGGLAIKKFSEGKKMEGLFHLVNAVLGVYFPVYYFLHATASAPMRLHHSFLGLLISLAPFTTTKIYGSITTIDSGLYHIFPHRGYWEYNWGWNRWHFSRWDFQNLVINHKALYPVVFGTTTAAEVAAKGALS